MLVTERGSFECIKIWLECKFDDSITRGVIYELKNVWAFPHKYET